ncbi:acyl-CoA thioesterase [Ectobacillus ponti]|uniref:Acyl-CoA thioesterase n=1 Tax=Ectobacillus ponti TaxID=2961894 RepID=A0AA41X5S6_9BACI|nr:thioesterase family protein [Ectobacillus ponti]MCP8967370.1 acyl-CoA thioesterase [Ectobacillus ponti]
MRQIAYIENAAEWENGFRFYMTTKVRFSETDMFGHLNNKVPFTYFEEARIEFFKELGLMQKWTEKACEAMIVVANLQCDYLRQVYFDEKLRVYVKVQSVGNSSVDMHYMIKNEQNQVCITGRSTMVQASKKTGKGIAWLQEQKEGLLRL